MNSANFFCDLADTTTPLTHFWEHTVGIEHAGMALRADWQSQLRRCHDELGFHYVRFHGLLSDDVGTLIRHKERLLYSFFNADQIFDFLLSIGMNPFVELSFMPKALASGNTTVFNYQANVTPPREKRIGSNDPLYVDDCGLKLDWSAGKATLTTVPSVYAILEPRMVAARIQGPVVLLQGATAFPADDALIARLYADISHSVYLPFANLLLFSQQLLYRDMFNQQHVKPLCCEHGPFGSAHALLPRRPKAKLFEPMF